MVVSWPLVPRLMPSQSMAIGSFRFQMSSKVWLDSLGDSTTRVRCRMLVFSASSSSGNGICGGRIPFTGSEAMGGPGALEIAV